jgi:hypothetical protein
MHFLTTRIKSLKNYFLTSGVVKNVFFKRKFFIGLLSSVQQFIYNMYIYIYLFLEYRGVILANRWIHL